MIRKYEIIYEAAPIPNRVNEDSYYYGESNGTIIACVVDGVTPRLELKKIKKLFAEYEANNGATYASRIVSSVCGQNFSFSPKHILMSANSILRRRVESIYSDFEIESILAYEPELQGLIADRQHIRLTLPAAVATIIRIQRDELRASFAHAGDTSLFLFKRDGDVQQLTKAQMEQHDQSALREAQKIKQENNLTHISEAISDPRIKQYNFDNALFHNFVNSKGEIDIDRGVGIINGMVELEPYIQTGTFALNDVSGILLTSDGAILPSPLIESEQECSERLQKMRHIIENRGLADYLQELRKMEIDDLYFDTYPRFKLHDDATAIYWKFES